MLGRVGVNPLPHKYTSDLEYKIIYKVLYNIYFLGEYIHTQDRVDHLGFASAAHVNRDRL